MHFTVVMKVTILNDDENYDENNEQQQLPEGFANSCYKTVPPILPQKLINNFANLN